MTLKQKIGQKLVAGFTGTEIPEEFIRLVEEHYIGNVILFAHNLVSKDQAAALCQSIQDLIKKNTGQNAFITIDQEGGRVTRLPHDCINVPGAMAISSTGKPENAYLSGMITGRQLRYLGINFNLSPVMDINTNPDNPIIGVRSYGDNPQTVAQFSLQAAQGYLDAGILAAGKHFPGHGDTDVDSHISLPMVSKSRDELERTELLPYRMAIKHGIPAIMTSHILFPALDNSGTPATMSREILTGLLRKELGFEGLILTDGMEMNAIKEYYGVNKGCIEAARAGADLLLICHQPDMAEEAAKELLKAYESGYLDTNELDQSVDRIHKYKLLYADPKKDTTIPDWNMFRSECERMYYESISSISGKASSLGEKPIFWGPAAYRNSIAARESEKIDFSGYMANYFGAKGFTVSQNPSSEEIDRLIKHANNATSLIIGLCNGAADKGQILLASKLAETGIPTIAIAFMGPYDLKYLNKNIVSIAAFEYSEITLKAVADVLSGKYIPTGKLGVRL